MVDFANHKDELAAIGASVFAASVDTGDNSKTVADEVNFPVGEGVTRADADALGSWWEDRRDIIQPSEFVLNSDNKVIHASYSSGPLARTEAGDVIKLINFLESQK